MSLLDAPLGESRRWTRVGDYYEVSKKPRSLDRSSFELIPFATMESIPQDGTYAPTFKMRSPDAIASGTYFERGDLLVAKITPSFENGKQALIFDLPQQFGYATTEVIPLRPRNRDYDPRLLFFYLLHPDVRHYVAERMEGSTGRQRVPEKVLLDLPIPELRPEEQTVMADALEAIQRASAAEDTCERAVQALKRVAMRELFTRGLRGEVQKETDIGLLPKSWTPTPVAKVGIVKGGKRMPKGVSLVQEDTGYPYIRVTDFKSHSVRDDGVLFVPRGYEGIIQRYRISARDVYISIAGSIGIVGQVPERFNDANLTENAARIVFDREDIAPRYVMYALASQVCQDQIARATAKNAQPKLALTRIEQILLPLPPTLDEQQEIVEILDALDRKSDLHKRKRAVLENLFKALLHKLMTGEIRVADLDLSELARPAIGEAAA